MSNFENEDAIQADMFRWMVRHMTNATFMSLTKTERPIDELEMLRILRESYLNDYSAEVGNRGAQASKIRQGILPAALGEAMGTYTVEAMKIAHRCGAEGRAVSMIEDAQMEANLQAVCEEIARLAK